MVNKNILFWLEKIQLEYDSDPLKTVHQKRAISKGIYSIKQYDKEITSKKDAIKLKGIGKSLAEKIDVILKTGEYPIEQKKRKINDVVEDTSKIKENLMKITGIGSKKAENYIKLGIKNHKDLLIKIENNELKVTDHILIGLKYYDDFNERINKSEVDQFNTYFKKIFTKLDLIYDICGSYRRNKDTCGDIDILVTHSSFDSNEVLKDKQIMKNIIQELTNSNILVKKGSLTPDAVKKYMGTCKLPIENSKARRLDIRLAIYNSYSTSLMYFTGSKEFNLKMRNKAIDFGYMLNEYGLYNSDKIPFEISSENDIFKLLDEPYLKPEER